MKTQWIVVAKESRPGVLEQRPGSTAENTPVADLVHLQSRQKGEQLASDRPGTVEGTGHGLSSSKYQPRTDPRERKHERFPREVTSTLNAGVTVGRCGGIVFVASDPFLGHLRSHLGMQGKKLLLHTVAHDYTPLRDDELAHRLGMRVRSS